MPVLVRTLAAALAIVQAVNFADCACGQYCQKDPKQCRHCPAKSQKSDDDCCCKTPSPAEKGDTAPGCLHVGAGPDIVSADPLPEAPPTLSLDGPEPSAALPLDDPADRRDDRRARHRLYLDLSVLRR